MNIIEISNFKNFSNIRLDNLGTVNLIVGRNNAGKSTLLEALSIIASGGDISWIKRLLEIRGLSFPNARLVPDSQRKYTAQDEKERACLASLYHNYDQRSFFKEPIRLRAKSDNAPIAYDIEVSLKFVELMELTETEEGSSLVRRRLVRKPEDVVEVIDADVVGGIELTVNGHSSVFPFGRGLARRFNAEEKALPFEYVRTAEFVGDRNPALFDAVALTPLEPVLIEALHIIEPRIEAINFLKDETDSRFSATDSRVPYVVLQGDSKKYRLSAMGDGINRILTILLSMLNAAGGVLLVDEFENGLHYSVQDELWKLIFRLARELKMQVFATTHSDDCIKSFLRASSDTDDARLIRLEKRRDRDIAVIYGDTDELGYISAKDIETR